MKQGYVGALERLTRDNRDFRRVLFTAGHLQLVLMALRPGEEIGSEVHMTHDQFFRIEKGKGRIRIDGVKIRVAAGDAILVPAGVRHNLTNTGKRRLRLYTIYAPPNHADQLVEATRAIADAHEKARALAASAEQGRKDMIDEGGPVAAATA
ncbi:cupin domain-containing protein [Pseudogemmobacter blasticus]|uniref:Cupin domain-containing protein n=1 Tax=Fuscovulum blasticum DSM 2131 TaxID=1188250 RepID=A0A2T4JE05_FUSBL|nr:cupin domain-containing protein [Fuscovulum blasticum]PTE16145.1 cupin domain-containing protein [Fuscovulum blasticum DSM 2131]